MSDTLVDARGLRCPLPVIRLAAAAKGLPAGTELTVLSTDPAAKHDVPAWCRMRGHEHVATREHHSGSPGEEGRDAGADNTPGDEGWDETADEGWDGWAVTVRLG
ncbi:sulfurtransferase TusA family protein [Promicromonospora sukumoe]|uniref:tRNA 2-thiouridine synthesizing protein A n=1 Tax=Promicromonospora sukumoe TaxID=88382 RepID=A0A7W3PEP8_9MICO|nr:sulfurtransferase TusA family protein [Promicromonospora sukumoe]MBA8809098.1 tRNA 2-thiouridine synthesizing protein A [Promicromonospora sukumoe]